jgi:hypothetical protein
MFSAKSGAALGSKHSPSHHMHLVIIAIIIIIIIFTGSTEELI